MRVHIITDSASDLSQEVAAQWGITVMPLAIRFGDTEYRDGVTLSNAAFYEKLLPELPKVEEREYDLREYRRWPVVLDVCRDFQESAEFDEMEITPPDSESSYGSVDLILATICPREHTIHSEGVRKLKYAVSKAGTVEFEVFAGGGKNDETVFALHFTS